MTIAKTNYITPDSEEIALLTEADFLQGTGGKGGQSKNHPIEDPDKNPAI